MVDKTSRDPPMRLSNDRQLLKLSTNRNSCSWTALVTVMPIYFASVFSTRRISCYYYPCGRAVQCLSLSLFLSFRRAFSGPFLHVPLSLYRFVLHCLCEAK